MDHTAWTDIRKERLFRDMHLLVVAGVDPRTMLDLLVEAQAQGRSVEALRQVREAVLSGITLSAAMSEAGVFSAHEEHAVRVGEESGRLGDILLQLADHHAERIALRRLVRQAFAYPLFVLAVTMVVVLFMMNVVVPMFAEVFARSGAELPALTAGVLLVSQVLRSAWPVLLGGLVLLSLGVARLDRHAPFRRWKEGTLDRMPVLGPLSRKAGLARFCSAMAFLLRAGTPLDRALFLAEGMAGTARSREALSDVRGRVIAGSSLRQAMSAHPAFDADMVAMIGVAEEVKQLDRMFGRLAERYAADVKHRTTMLGSVLEPVTILIIALLVGTVLVAMYLPMFKLSTTM
ncbi:MAG TPA: type II secretion system F family protein [Flavobacteriales bacterium]|nr:type II secretion system F family protein [Flavobacteriales bacterium]HMR28508.1 type II secretion system F family protein [Flavobacteriales bacterium]